MHYLQFTNFLNDDTHVSIVVYEQLLWISAYIFNQPAHYSFIFHPDRPIQKEINLNFVLHIAIRSPQSKKEMRHFGRDNSRILCFGNRLEVGSCSFLVSSSLVLM